jgi:hypothetical protein
VRLTAVASCTFKTVVWHKSLSIQCTQQMVRIIGLRIAHI